MRKQALYSFLLAMGYGLGFILLQFFLYKTGIVSTLPDATNLLGWDANWYQSIVQNGYQYWEGANDNTGFFILFPLIWKVLCLNAWTVSLLNLFFFSVGFAVFNTLYKVSTPMRLLWLTIPSFYFVWVPYTEALFILLVSLCFAGVAHSKRYLIWASLFLLALTRPTTLVLLPAFLIMELLCNNRQSWLTALKVFVINYALPLIAGLALFVWYQHYATGVWFPYFIQQSTAWGHKFAWPTLPFNSMFGYKLLWLNAAALFTGFITLLLLIGYGVRWLIINDVQKDRLFVLSCLYFTGISLVTILFNPVWGTFTTNVYDIHRYAFVSPFFWVLLHRFTIVNTYKPVHYVAIILLSNLFWLTFGHYTHIQQVLYFNFVTAFVLMYMMSSDKKLSWIALVIAAINVVFQVHMFQWFISGVYPG